MNPEGRSHRPGLAVGVDIGGTKIVAGLVDARGEVLTKLRVETPAGDPDSIESAIAGLVDQLITEQRVAAVGVAAAGFVAADSATVRFAPNLAWRDHDLGGRLARLTGLPVLVENDANAAGWAEYRFGAAAGAGDIVALTLGTGLGGAVIVGGQLVRGGQGMAAEVGHLRVVPDGEPCGCGQRGCWEQYVSGSALARAAREAAAADPIAARALLAAAADQLVTGEVVASCARNGDPLAISLWHELGRWLGAGVASLAAVLDPTVVVVGGGLAAEADLFLPAALAELDALLPGRSHRDRPQLVASPRSEDLGIIGSADLAMNA